MDPRGSRNARTCPVLARAECQVCGTGTGVDERENEKGGGQEALKLRPVLRPCAPETLRLYKPEKHE